MVKLTFLGTGGGRFVTLTQERSTGGLYLEDGYKVHIDPGPGALNALKRNRIDPTKTHGLMISHCHPDHYANAEILMEGMNTGRRGRRGFVIAARSVVEARGKVGPALSQYHLGKMQLVLGIEKGEDFKVGGLKGIATPSYHSDPDGIGFRISTRHGDISYVSDTEMREEITGTHSGARILILPVTRPLQARIPYHLSTEDAAFIAEKTQPELVILNHMGKKFLKEGPRKQARWIEERSGIRTIAGEDDLRIVMKEKITAFSQRRKRPIRV